MGLKQRLAGGDVRWGSFLKTPSPILDEVLARAGLDLVCIDAEHAPFDRSPIDVLVRTPIAAPEHILSISDCGAEGVLLPHIRSAGRHGLPWRQPSTVVAGGRKDGRHVRATQRRRRLLAHEGSAAVSPRF